MWVSESVTTLYFELPKPFVTIGWVFWYSPIYSAPWNKRDLKGATQDFFLGVKKIFKLESGFFWFTSTNKCRVILMKDVLLIAKLFLYQTQIIRPGNRVLTYESTCNMDILQSKTLKLTANAIMLPLCEVWNSTFFQVPNLKKIEGWKQLLISQIKYWITNKWLNKKKVYICLRGIKSSKSSYRKVGISSMIWLLARLG